VTAFAGVDHLGLSVTDLDVSERFYTGVLGFDRLVDFGEVRILIDRPSSFVLSLSRHAGARPGPFSELTTGLDHVGLTAGSRDELAEWEDWFRAAGVAFMDGCAWREAERPSPPDEELRPSQLTGES